MRALEAIVILTIIGVVIVVILAPILAKSVNWVYSKFKKKHDENEPWTMGEVTNNGFTRVFIFKPSEGRQYIGEPISLALETYEYDEQLTEVRLNALDKASSLNRKLLPG